MRAVVTQLWTGKDISWSAKTDVNACAKNTFSKKTAISSKEMRKNHKDKTYCLVKNYLARQEKMVLKEKLCWG